MSKYFPEIAWLRYNKTVRRVLCQMICVNDCEHQNQRWKAVKQGKGQVKSNAGYLDRVESEPRNT